jgi:iron complex transport system substrate-binding protein
MLHRISLLLVTVFTLAACGAQPSAQPPAEPAATVDQQPAAAEPTSAPEPASAPEPTSAPTTDATAVGTTTEATGSYTATDATGTTITLDEPAQRIACAASPCVDSLLQLGLEPVAIGPADSAVEVAAAPEYYGERAKAFTVIGGPYEALNLEDIVAVQPDLVIAFELQTTLREGLGDIPVFYMRLNTIEDGVALLRSVGALTGRSNEAEAAISAFDERVAEYVAQISERRSVGVIMGSDVNFEVFTDKHPGGDLLNRVAINPFALPEGAVNYGGSMPYSMEQLLAEDPEVLFTITPLWASSDIPLAEVLAETPLWGELQAVREQRIHTAPAEWSNVGGLHSLGIMLDQAMPLIYPETFPNPLP